MKLSPLFCLFIIFSIPGIARSAVLSQARMTCKNISAKYQSKDAKWIWSVRPPNASTAEAVTLILHGLNTSPDKMKELSFLFLKQNHEVLSVTLTGHGGDLEAFKKVSRKAWLNDVYRGYCLARKQADELGLPLYVLGYSLGGLLAVDLLSEPDYENVAYDKMVLIAPALAVNRTSHLVSVLNVFGEDFVVPSANEKSYRANSSGTSMAAYNSLFDSLTALQSKNLAKVNVPTLVVVDPSDELVSSDGITELIRQNHLNQWHQQLIDNDESYLETSYHHLMIDDLSMGFRNWNLMASWIRNFIGEY